MARAISDDGRKILDEIAAAVQDREAAEQRYRAALQRGHEARLTTTAMGEAAGVTAEAVRRLLKRLEG